MFMYIDDPSRNFPIAEEIGKLLIAQGYTEANGNNLLGFTVKDYDCKLCVVQSKSFPRLLFLPGKRKDALPEGAEIYRGFVILKPETRDGQVQDIDAFYRDAMQTPTGKILTSVEHTMLEHDRTWGYSKNKLGKALLEKAAKTKHDSWFDAWNDRSLEHYDHIVSFVNSLIESLRCTESVDGETYRYAYRDAVLFEANMNEVTFPALNDMLSDFRDRKHEILDNPLLGFLTGFLALDSHIYGPAQGLYRIHLNICVGYLLSHYPETQEWLLPDNPGSKG